MNDVPTLSDASWMIRGMGYGVVLGAVVQGWAPFHVVAFGGVLFVIAGQYVAFRFWKRSAAA